MSSLDEVDPQIAGANRAERKRQPDTLDLIASELPRLRERG